MSPMLFNLVLADLKEEMERARWKGVTLGEGKVLTLSYTEDMVLIITKGEDEMRSIMERLKGYMDRKGLEVNVGETKIMRFKKGEGEKER